MYRRKNREISGDMVTGGDGCDTPSSELPEKNDEFDKLVIVLDLISDIVPANASMGKRKSA